MHQMIDALVHVAKALFEPHHRFAIGGEAEMARLDDAGVNRADGNLMQAFAFHRQERIGGRIRTMVEPRARVGQSDRLESEQIARRTLQANGRRVQCANGRVAIVRAVEAQHDNAAIQHGHVDPTWLAPEAEQRCLAGSDASGCLLPVRGIDHGHPSNAATCWNQATSGPGSQMPAISTSARCANIGT